jgi:hypothetical protein
MISGAESSSSGRLLSRPIAPPMPPKPTLGAPGRSAKTAGRLRWPLAPQGRFGGKRTFARSTRGSLELASRMSLSLARLREAYGPRKGLSPLSSRWVYINLTSCPSNADTGLTGRKVYSVPHISGARRRACASRPTQSRTSEERSQASPALASGGRRDGQARRRSVPDRAGIWLCELAPNETRSRAPCQQHA